DTGARSTPKHPRHPAGEAKRRHPGAPSGTGGRVVRPANAGDATRRHVAGAPARIAAPAGRSGEPGAPVLTAAASAARGAGGAALALVAGLALALTPADSAADSGGVSISYSIDGIAGTNGWYRGSTHGNFVVLKWFVTDPNSQVIDTSGCSAVLQIPGPQVNT